MKTREIRWDLERAGLRWNLDLYIDVMVTVTRRMNSFYSLSTQTKSLMRRRPGRNFDRVVVVDAFHLDRAAQNSLWDRYGYVRVNVLFVSAEYLTRLNPESHVDLLFADVHAHRLAIFDTSRDRNRHSPVLLSDPFMSRIGVIYIWIIIPSWRVYLPFPEHSTHFLVMTSRRP